MICDPAISILSIPLTGILDSSMSKDVCGIYVFENVKSGMSYVGSSRNIYKRFHQHRGTLRKGIHKNINLQTAYNEHGESAFIFVIVELSEDDLVMKREDEWLAKHYESGMLYNLHETATYDGNTFSDDTRARISSGLRRHWTNPENRAAMSKKLMGHENCARPFRIKSPTGEIIEGRNMAKFCREHGLSNGQMSDMMAGKTSHCGGWSNPDIVFKSKKTKLNPTQIPEIRALFSAGNKQKDIAIIFGVTRSAIAAVTQGRAWTNIK